MSKVNHVQKISLSEKLGYGIGDLASNLVFSAIGSFMTFFYTDIAGSAASFGTKVGAGLGVALIGWTLSSGGYMGGAEVQTESALRVIMGLFLYVPIGIAIAIVQFILLMGYKLDKQYPQIVEELHARNNGDSDN